MWDTRARKQMTWEKSGKVSQEGLTYPTWDTKMIPDSNPTPRRNPDHGHLHPSPPPNPARPPRRSHDAQQARLLLRDPAEGIGWSLHHQPHVLRRHDQRRPA